VTANSKFRNDNHSLNGGVPGCIGRPRGYGGCDLGFTALYMPRITSCSFFWGGRLSVSTISRYEWAFIVHPFFLESSELSLELADYLGRSTFWMVSVRFQYLTRLAKVAI